MNLIPCKALRAFTQFVPGFGQVHGDPDNQDERVSFPQVPESYVQFLADEGKIEAPEGSLAASINGIMERLSSVQIDPGTPIADLQPRDLADGETLAAAPLFTVTHVSGPNFDVFGPGMDAPERIKGKAAAEARAADLEKAMAHPVDAPTIAWEPETATEDAAPV